MQAAISALHAEAPTAQATDWHQIEALYASLARITSSMVVEVNHVVAVAMARGLDAGLDFLLPVEDQAAGYYLCHAARADLLRRTNLRETAADASQKALALHTNGAERTYLQRRLDEMLNA